MPGARHCRHTLTALAALVGAAVGTCSSSSCSSNPPASTACADLLACCGSMATADLQAMCMSKLPDTSNAAACSAQLSAYKAQGQCVDAGAQADAASGPAPSCMMATYPCTAGLSLVYCRVLDDAGACSSSYYVAAGQTFACASCTDMSACGSAARNACIGGDASAGE